MQNIPTYEVKHLLLDWDLKREDYILNNTVVIQTFHNQFTSIAHLLHKTNKIELIVATTSNRIILSWISIY